MSGASSDEVKAFSHVTNEARLLETQKPHQVRHTASGVELRWFTPSDANHITETIDRFNKQRPIKSEYKTMGKLHEASLRITAQKKKLEEAADDLLHRLDGLDAKVPDVFAKAHGIINAQNADINAMDSELRQLSNSLEST